MMLRTYTPRPPLSDFVELLWLYGGYAQPHVKERSLPTGTLELVINLSDDRLRVFDRRNTDHFQSFRGSMICGAHSEFFIIDSNQDETILGVHFKPGGAYPFLKLPAGELHNAHVSLDTLWGAKAAGLRDQLLDTKTPEARFRILEQVLVAQTARPLAWHPAVAFALKEFQAVPHARTTSTVADQIGLCQRRFIQVFRDQVGLTPKLFCRVQRFQAVLRLIGKGRRVEWADVALACGYYDQAHLINDFQSFSGLNPTAYVRNRDECRLNHVQLAD